MCMSPHIHTSIHLKSKASHDLVGRMYFWINPGRVNIHNPPLIESYLLTQIKSLENVHFLLPCSSTSGNDPMIKIQKKRTATCSNTQTQHKIVH